MRQKIVAQKSELLQIISGSKTCFVAMVDSEGKPYNLPFNFGFDEDYIYLHSGTEGKKMTILRSNPNVCIAFSNSEEIAYQSADVACSHFMKYKSVLVWGPVEFIDDPAEKIAVMNKFMKHYTGREDFKYNMPAINNVQVYRVSTKNISGKTYGF
ncbi:MAG: hypothetical protein A2W93_12755 [Bacteroidetes bacterium GWF2_43_63]|nr:MAG: hypothetical protein A2W94_06400 [Bacteroidetes bacterium GWE2_42_42]OFY54651.1 MAG: hypothetical protein A2W93_12755 [Bacteroidetes bacterium GWF2_43_63]HBG71841.1 MFS transporter [Bacteroidales bacterium]HCB61424.1 MFS transporter [Bacteroidales bacterium]HCY23341.1 MFS transporter [Bacteroidales bacterium]